VKRMALIDTLKLAHALRDKGGFTEEAAEGTAQALNEALTGSAATKADIADLRSNINADIADLRSNINADIADLRGDIKALEAKVTMIVWAIGLNAAATIAVLIKHW
jgi:hypothetical protein